MKNFKQKKILISGYYGFDNFGDEAILQTLVTNLKRINCDITVLSHNPKKTASNYDVKSINSFSILKVFINILKCDIFISGGGSLLQDTTSLKSLIYYLLLLNIAILSRKKVIIFAQGLGPFRNKKGAFWVKNTIKRCTYVSVRDKKSHYLLKQWGIKSDLVCDPVFSIPIGKANPQKIVGIQLRHTKNLNINYIKKLADYVVKNFANNEIEIYSFQDALDLDVCTKFKNFLKEKGVDSKIISNKTPFEMIEHISRLNYLIAMRFHAVLTAVRFGIKTLAISYDMKVEKFAKEFKIPCLNMKSNDDFEQAFNDLKHINTKRILELSNEKHFDWQNIEKVIG